MAKSRRRVRSTSCASTSSCCTSRTRGSTPAAAPILFAQLGIERPEVVEHAEKHEAAGQEVEQAREPLAHVKTVNTEKAEERQEDPGDVVADRSRDVAHLGRAFHPGNEENIDKPADSEEPQSEKPDRAGHRPAEIEAVRAGKAKNPQKITNDLAVRVRANVHRRLPVLLPLTAKYDAAQSRPCTGYTGARTCGWTSGGSLRTGAGALPFSGTAATRPRGSSWCSSPPSWRGSASRSIPQSPTRTSGASACMTSTSKA